MQMPGFSPNSKVSHNSWSHLSQISQFYTLPECGHLMNSHMWSVEGVYKTRDYRETVQEHSLPNDLARAGDWQTSLRLSSALFLGGDHQVCTTVQVLTRRVEICTNNSTWLVHIVIGRWWWPPSLIEWAFILCLTEWHIVLPWWKW